MKKITLSLVLALHFVFFLPTTSFAQAACFHLSPGTTCTQVSCGSVCCRTSTDCSQYLNNQPNTNVRCPSGDGINTAIGCIPINDTNTFTAWVLGWAIGVGGGIAFLLIIYGSFMIMTSQGIPDRLKAGKEILTSAISGLLMLIFSVFILSFIGFDILGLDLL